MTKEEAMKFLKELCENIQLQSNRWTASPIFCVYDIEREYCSEYDDFDGSEFDSDYSEIESNYDEDGNEIENPEPNVRWKNVEKRSRVVNWALFTEKAAQEAIDRKRHDLNKPFIYVEWNGWNNEFDKLVNAIHTITDTPMKGWVYMAF